jgi:hypothetical protein
MTYEFLRGPDSDHDPAVLAFFQSVDHCSIEQHPYWPENRSAENACRFIAFDEKKKIVCTAIIQEYRKLGIQYADLKMGPLFSDADVLVQSLAQIHEHYRKRKFSKLTVQLAFPTGALADLVEYKVARLLPVRYVFDRDNWSSVIVDLRLTEEELFKNLSKTHKRHIKKAVSLNISVNFEYTHEELQEFIGIYLSMTTQRGLSYDQSKTYEFTNSLKTFFDQYHAGRFVIVKSSEGRVIGGLILVYQGKVVRYYRGASDPAARDLPVMHLAFWESFKLLRQEGFETFDLWGYNHFVDETDQIFFVNQFKRGFGGDYIFYPKKMYFIYNPLQNRIIDLARKVHKRITRKKVSAVYAGGKRKGADKLADENTKEASVRES